MIFVIMVAAKSTSSNSSVKQVMIFVIMVAANSKTGDDFCYHGCCQHEMKYTKV